MSRSTNARNEQGMALITVLLVALAVSGIALAGAMWTLNAALITKSGDRTATLNDVALAGLEEGRSFLNANPAVYPITGYATLATNETVTDVLGNVVPHVNRSIYVGPDGITGHRDHRIVSTWVTEAWRRVGHGELLYATMTDEFVSRHAGLHERIGLFTERADDGPASYPTDQMDLTCDLSDGELDRKRRALGQHASQTRPLAALMGEDTYRTWWRTEWFRRATPEEAATCVLCPPVAVVSCDVDDVAA